MNAYESILTGFPGKSINDYRVFRWVEMVLDNPFLPALIFGVFIHLSRLCIHLVLGNNIDTFFPDHALHYVTWLGEFIIPYLGILGIAFVYRRTSESMQNEILETLRQRKEIQEVSILGFARLIEVKDPDTGNHNLRIGHFAKMLAREVGTLTEYSSYVTRRYCDDIFLSAPLHDIGKIGIRDNILKKSSSLTEQEYAIMKMHTIMGGDILHELERKLGYRSFFTLGCAIAYHHHQHYDGSGYPNVLGREGALFVEKDIGSPLKGKVIPLSARIVAICDVYDALLSKRCYKDAIPREKVREMMLQQSGRQFDPRILQAFFRIEEDALKTFYNFSR